MSKLKPLHGKIVGYLNLNEWREDVAFSFMPEGEGWRPVAFCDEEKSEHGSDDKVDAGVIPAADAEAREAFEKWVVTNGWEGAIGKIAYQVNGLWSAEEYAHKTVDCMWQAWLAAWNQRAPASEAYSYSDWMHLNIRGEPVVARFQYKPLAEASATQHEGTKASS